MIVYKMDFCKADLIELTKPLQTDLFRSVYTKVRLKLKKIYFILSFGIVYDLDSVENEKP